MKIVSSQQMRAIDKAASRQFGILPLLLMENAGRSVADVVEKTIRNNKTQVTILCGYGNNGGDGFVVARHLSNRGYAVRVLLIGKRKPMSEESRINYAIIQRMRISIKRLNVPQQLHALKRYRRKTSLFIDAIFGIGMRGSLSPFYSQLIDAINKSGVKVFSIDIPSGLDADRGVAISAAIRAHTTVTMGLLKRGFSNPLAKKYCGKIIVADISLPNQLKRTS